MVGTTFIQRQWLTVRRQVYPVLLLAAVFAVVVAGRAFGSLEAARALYLRGASFHGFLELAFALRLCMVGRERIVGV